MKFLVSKDSAPAPLLKRLMVGVTVFILLYLVTDLLLHGVLFGSSIEAISSTFYGNDAEFVEPILFETLLLQAHIDLFMALIALMVLSSVYIRLTVKTHTNRTLLHALFLSGVSAPLLLTGAYFGSDVIIYLWAAAFLLWHLLAFWTGLSVLQRLLR